MEQDYDLARRVAEEIARSQNYVLPMEAGLEILLHVVAGLQLAMRHPGMSAKVRDNVLYMIEQIIQRMEDEGFTAIAEIMRRGNNPENDS